MEIVENHIELSPSKSGLTVDAQCLLEVNQFDIQGENIDYIEGTND